MSVSHSFLRLPSVSFFLPPVNENPEYNEVRKRDSLDFSYSQVLSVSDTKKETVVKSASFSRRRTIFTAES